MAFKIVKKDCLCFELNLHSKNLSLLESLYLELNITPENSVEISTDSSHHDNISAIMKFSLPYLTKWKFNGEISEEEFSILYREWLKSKKIKEYLHIKYQESFTRDEFCTYIMKSLSNLDSEINTNLSYYLSLLHSEYNEILTKESFLGFGDNNKRIGGIEKHLIDELDGLFNVYDNDELGHLTFDKILFLFLVLYVSSIDNDENCDLFLIKREFQKFLIEIKEFNGKLTLRQFKNYFIQKELIVKQFLLKVKENSITFAKILNFLISKTTATPPDAIFPKVLEIAFIKTINTTKIIENFYEESLSKIEFIRTKHPSSLYSHFTHLYCENFFREAYFLKIFDKNRMPCKLRFYSTTPRTFEEFFTAGFLKSHNIAFSEDFFSAFTNHIEQIFEDVLAIYKRYFKEIDVMDFDNFFRPDSAKKYLNKEFLEDKSSILPFKVHANFVLKNEHNNSTNITKKTANTAVNNNGYFKYEFDESSIENISYNNNENNRINLNKPNKSDNFSEILDKNTSQDAQSRSNLDENSKKNAKATSFYSYPQSNPQIPKKNLNFNNYSVGVEGNSRVKDEDFVMRNVQKIQKMYVRGPEPAIISRKIDVFDSKLRGNNSYHSNRPFYEDNLKYDFVAQREKENNSNYPNISARQPYPQKTKHAVQENEKTLAPMAIDLSNFSKKKGEKPYQTERTPVKEKEVQIFKQKPNNTPLSIQKTSRLNSTEHTNKKYHVPSRNEKRSVSPNYYYHKVETFETVIKRLKNKGTTAEKPREPFH